MARRPLRPRRGSRRSCGSVSRACAFAQGGGYRPRRSGRCGRGRAWSETTSPRRACGGRSDHRPVRPGSHGVPSAAAPRAPVGNRSGAYSQCGARLTRPPTTRAGIAPRCRRRAAQRIADLASALPGRHRRVIGDRDRRLGHCQGQRYRERRQGPSPRHLISDQSSEDGWRRPPAEGPRPTKRSSARALEQDIMNNTGPNHGRQRDQTRRRRERSTRASRARAIGQRLSRPTPKPGAATPPANAGLPSGK